MNDLWGSNWAQDQVANSLKAIAPFASAHTAAVKGKMARILDSFAIERLGTHHFTSITGYAHGDQSREVLERIFARVLGAESAAVRLQFVSGTHAIATALYGVLRPGHRLLAITGRPYDTLENVIGIRDSGQGSLLEFGILYDEIPLTSTGSVDKEHLDQALSEPTHMVLIQRSCGYSWRPSLSISEIERICRHVHSVQPSCVCFVDNCYGEMVENREPTSVGADLIAGSLIKNLGGTLVPTGGYIAGRQDLVEQSCYRLNSPGIGSKGGTGFDLYRLVFQGLFLAPQMVAEALIGAELVASVFSSIGYQVNPLPGGNRSDIIQAVCLGSAESLKVVCRAFQASSPVGAYLDPVPADMPGYSNELIMAGGSFIDGSTSEFSADGPLREPYILYTQGGTHRSHQELALVRALTKLQEGGCLST
ncbi:Cystathionine beta-lyase family protein (chromatophore) [Paulinella micropora]|uniref:Cystathionine beta-lyase family protein n=1 Tax=Paulinella micropora TaxID=1928728 RepID=A0A1L5YBU2_9EUKA|nr:hypothetical protein PCKR_364 [Paulinella micropora]AQX44918.1 hypothetical protein PFK_364 [Paulinella micropora]BBL86132.1 Cystathionine beta-lyase family protein [Paulinella micropora]